MILWKIRLPSSHRVPEPLLHVWLSHYWSRCLLFKKKMTLTRKSSDHKNRWKCSRCQSERVTSVNQNKQKILIIGFQSALSRTVRSSLPPTLQSPLRKPYSGLEDSRAARSPKRSFSQWHSCRLSCATRRRTSSFLCSKTRPNCLKFVKRTTKPSSNGQNGSQIT